LFYAPRPFEWGEQIVVITGGSSGVGELLANTLAVKSVTVVVLDLKPIQTQNCMPAFGVREFCSRQCHRQYRVLQVRRVKMGGGRGRLEEDHRGGKVCSEP
jgi:hypothetical protein